MFFLYVIRVLADSFICLRPFHLLETQQDGLSFRNYATWRPAHELVVDGSQLSFWHPTHTTNAYKHMTNAMVPRIVFRCNRDSQIKTMEICSPLAPEFICSSALILCRRNGIYLNNSKSNGDDRQFIQRQSCHITKSGGLYHIRQNSVSEIGRIAAGCVRPSHESNKSRTTNLRVHGDLSYLSKL